MLNDCSAEFLVWWSHLLNPITKHLNVIAEILSTELRVNPDRNNSGKEKKKKSASSENLCLNVCTYYSLQKDIKDFFFPF